jgi:hypothetical protein
LPLLSYCFASFHAGDYDHYSDRIGRIWSLGFRSVTLVPTFAVREQFEIGLDYTHTLEKIRAVLMHALGLGLDVKLEPHLDWQSTLDGEGKWRGLMQFNPADDYFDRVIAPLRDLACEAKVSYPERRVSLTLGSEVDRSVREFPDAWMDVRNHAARYGLEIGHKVNHDAPSPIFTTGYLASLDYVAFSFYPKIEFQRPPEWWLSAQSGEELEALADAFEGRIAALARKLPLGPELQIGEFGLASGDVAHPYKVDPDFFRYMDAGSRELRRNYYQGFLRCCFRLPSAVPVTFWSPGYFDFLGVFAPEYEDEALISIIRAHHGVT